MDIDLKQYTAKAGPTHIFKKISDIAWIIYFGGYDGEYHVTAIYGRKTG
jgi:hypothetical protein